MGIEALDGLNEEAPAAVAEVIETPEIASPEVVETPATEEAPAEVVPPPVEEEKHVPLATFLDTRDKRKEAEKRAEAAEAEIAKLTAAKQAPAPDPYDDPTGFAAHQSQQVQAAVLANKFEMSDVIAKQVHGEDAVSAATTWAMEKAKSNPAFAAEYMREAHPIDWIVRQHKRDGIYSQLPSDISSLDELIEREIAKRGQTAPNAAVVAAVAQQVPKPAAPPKSLVNAPSHGGVSEVPVGKLAGMETVFPR